MSWCRAPLWGPWSDFTFFFLLPEICFALRLGAPSLARGRVCNLRCNLSVVRVAEDSQPYITVSPEASSVPFPTPLTTRRHYGGSILTRLHTARSPVFISPRSRVVQLYLWPMGSLSIASYDSQTLRWKYSYPPPHG
jgi:hypothetical protein